VCSRPRHLLYIDRNTGVEFLEVANELCDLFAFAAESPELYVNTIVAFPGAAEH
jgi:hypothetical protein